MGQALENLTKDQLISLLGEREERLRTERSRGERYKARAAKDLSQLEDEIGRANSKIADLQFQLAHYKRLVHGQKRERFEGNADQLSLPFEMGPEQAQKQEETAKEKIAYERRKGKSAHKGRMPLPDHLEVEQIDIHPEGDLTDMVHIGSEVTDELEYEPARYWIKRYVRHKYAPKNGEGVLIGQLPSRAIERCIAGAGLLVSILVDKYMDHLPLYRQLQRFKRANIPIASSTLEGWTRQALKILDILYGHLLEDTKSQGYLQADESTIKVLDKNKKGAAHLGYYWVYHGPVEGTGHVPAATEGTQAGEVTAGDQRIREMDGAADQGSAHPAQEPDREGLWL